MQAIWASWHIQQPLFVERIGVTRKCMFCIHVISMVSKSCIIGCDRLKNGLNHELNGYSHHIRTHSLDDTADSKAFCPMSARSGTTHPLCTLDYEMTISYRHAQYIVLSRSLIPQFLSSQLFLDNQCRLYCRCLKHSPFFGGVRCCVSVKSLLATLLCSSPQSSTRLFSSQIGGLVGFHSGQLGQWFCAVVSPPLYWVTCLWDHVSLSPHLYFLAAFYLL